MSKHIFITGGVVSSLGKGLTTASIALLLKQRGLNVQIQKFDPYINVSPGLLSPAQHGEVFVLDDGSCADADFGHYARFTGIPLTRNNTWTTGQIYQEVAKREQNGDYHGAIIQVVPHITDEIKDKITALAQNEVDVVITEIGGTVGDIESLPFLEAIRQFAMDVGKENCLFVHLSLIPFLKAAKEIKTKPTQHSVGQLRQIGIQPDILICRTEVALSDEERAKIGLFCNIETDSVIEEKDKELSIYEVPLRLREKKLDDLILDKLRLNATPLEDGLSKWEALLRTIKNSERELTVALVGKFADKPYAYQSVEEALQHAAIPFKTKVNLLKTVGTSGENDSALNEADAIVLVGTNSQVIQWAKGQSKPFLAIGQNFQDGDFSDAAASSNEANRTIELREQPFCVATEYHPEFKSQPLQPQLLFIGLIRAALV